jgi:alkaline phosphatase D
VHVDVTRLEPAAEYFYRFRLGDEVSPVGRTRTLPAAQASPRELRLAFASCQDYGTGYYTAYRDLAARDLDFVLFLGDYIYEHGFFEFDGRANPTTEAVTLDDYRHRYALYKTDADLQAAHEAAPWVVTWDDHEVENNYAGAVPEDPAIPEADFLARRAAAYRAWWEHQPVRLPRPDGSNLRIHRTIRFGRLAEVQVLDTRQYRSPQCEASSDIGPRCDASFSPDTTLLGHVQERWLARNLRRTQARWNVLAQQVLMTESNFVTSSPDGIFSLDGWDGYPLARERLLATLHDERVANPVVLTGDIHCAWVNDLKADFADPASATVGTELVGTSVTSGFPLADFVSSVVADVPHVKYFEGNRRGYLRCTLDRREWRADHRYVSTITTPDATVETGASFVIEAGRPGAVAA